MEFRIQESKFRRREARIQHLAIKIVRLKGKKYLGTNFHE